MGNKPGIMLCLNSQKLALLVLVHVFLKMLNYAKCGFKTNWKEFAYSFDAQKVAGLPVFTDSGINIIPYKDAEFSNLKYDTSAFYYSTLYEILSYAKMT